METLMKGDVVIVSFPYSDLFQTKKRPALVIANIEGDDKIYAQITSSRTDQYGIQLGENEIMNGTLQRKSIIRPNKLFTLHRGLIEYKIGTLTKEKMGDVTKKIVEIVER